MNLIQASEEVLNQAKFYLEQISASEYTQPIPLLSGSTIGQHTRHFIEFYQCLLAQVNKKEINYCLRNRDLEIESSSIVALQHIDVIINEVDRLDLDASITLYTEKVDGERLETTVGRELYYNIEHCIHHLAIVKIGLHQVAPQLELSEQFGLAPSTVRHRKQLTES